MFIARFHFIPDRAPDFMDNGQEVTQMEFDNLGEVVGFAQEFADALQGTLVYNTATAQTVDLEDFAH